ncbi:nuclease SbcCD, D subunit [Prosthecochloris aestuarii DSM 271]|uniref:Nuclease SbcCD subunit D n=1 Tax=Prosthecochloris aestuarii (strain DSM 271 / SK 413) TaxID=290512 RepID=B4S801_PROA2|nr:exonuclease SbcCD subunit D C-terminal domain-containing protein [Prosthecochloris aestuarii]ACF46188.1 nuclease SbcCD, D subunit [Prosthecochloris aestuarii DSM 271]
MKFLHTSDWHIGAMLYGRKRYEEYERFLDWMVMTVESESVDLLMIAGDIFHTTTPGSRAQSLYYNFLDRIAASSCRHVVIIAGNHDSPSLLDAPRALLRALDIHVSGTASADPADEVIVLNRADGEPEAVVCAVPYLRDRDIRLAGAGEHGEEKTQRLIDAITAHYALVCDAAEARRRSIGQDIPLLVMGHLFAAGGVTADGDGVREIYVGSLARVPVQAFPPVIDYLALGHLHASQRLAGKECMRYSGAPLPMGFGEAARSGKIVLGETSGREISIKEIDVPCFQHLERLEGTFEELTLALQAMRQQASGSVWIEIDYKGSMPAGSLREELDAIVEGSQIEILRIRNLRVTDIMLEQMEQDEELDDLSEEEVFSRCMDSCDVPADEQRYLMQAYREILCSLHEEDRMEE